MTDNQPATPEKPEQKPEGSCGSCKGFNFCFWAKLIVAIPAIPLIAIAAAAQFSSMLGQMIAGGIAVFVAVVIAIKIDKAPSLSHMVVDKKTEKHQA